MKNIPFDQALTEAQQWVGQGTVYAVGESVDSDNNKVILVFTSDTLQAAKDIPKVFHGHQVHFYHTGVISPQNR